MTAANPESGTITYTYNDDGTVASKTMGKQNQTNPAVTVTATYSFDEIHRITMKSFNDGSTPTIRYLYDGVTPTACTPPTLTAANPKPRRTAMCDGAGASAWSYDVLGRELTEKRTTNGITKTTNYTYNLDGSVATLTYPSGRTITYTPGAAGRTVSAVDTANGISYATAAHYAPQGALASLQNGSGVVSTFYFNSRLQPCRISVKSSGTAPTQCSDTTNPGNVLDFSYSFSLGAGDNGNVVSIANNRDTTRSQSFTFDSLNRISTAKTASTTGSNCWDEAFGYDPWANLLSIGRVSGYSCTNEELLSVTATTNNRVSGNTHDAAGNLTTVPSVASYTYNAENQLTATAGVAYTYDAPFASRMGSRDGDGNRVSKSSGKLYWYGITSAPLAECDAAGNLTSEFVFFDGKRIARLQLPAATVNYYFADHLGTSRIVTDSTGAVLDDSDFYPFGGERIVSSSSGNTYKFTGKERDIESGLDYFGARYYGSSTGRFMSADPVTIKAARLLDPQRLNLYTYVRNNPLEYVDPDGRDMQLWIVVRDQSSRSTISQAAPRIASDFHRWGVKQVNIHITSDPSKVVKGSNTVVVSAEKNESMTQNDTLGKHNLLGTTVNTELANTTPQSERNVIDHETVHTARNDNFIDALLGTDHSSDKNDLMYEKYDPLKEGDPQLSPDAQKQLQDRFNQKGDKDEATVVDEDKKKDKPEKEKT